MEEPQLVKIEIKYRDLTFPESADLYSGPMMKWSVGQPSESISTISLLSTPSMATSSLTKISYGEFLSKISNLSANGSPTFKKKENSKINYWLIWHSSYNNRFSLSSLHVPTWADGSVSSPRLSVIFMATFGESTITSSVSAGLTSPCTPRSTSLATLLLVRSYWQVTASPRSELVTMVSWCWMTTSFRYLWRHKEITNWYYSLVQVYILVSIKW